MSYSLVLLLILFTLSKCGTAQQSVRIPKKFPSLTSKEKLLNHYKKLRLYKKKKQRFQKYKTLRYESQKNPREKIKLKVKVKLMPKIVIKRNENLIEIEQIYKFKCLEKNNYQDKSNKLCLHRVEQGLNYCKDYFQNAIITSNANISIEQCLKDQLAK